MLGVWVFLTFLAGALMYQQNEYVLEIEHIDAIETDEHYISQMTIHNFKHNRTCPRSVNFTVGFKQDIGTTGRVEVATYRFASNEYREFPMSFGFNLCEVLDQNEFGFQNIYACGNFSSCPLKKGKYFACNWSPDYQKFPPHMISGKYMFDLKFVWQSVQITRFHAFMTINYIFKS